jgi:hypothetical protein
MKLIVAGAMIFASVAALATRAQTAAERPTPSTENANASDRSGPLHFGLWAGTERAAAILATKNTTGIFETREHGNDVFFRDVTIGEQKCEVILSFFKGRLLTTAAFYSDPSTEESVTKVLDAKYGPSRPVVAGLDDKVWKISKPAATTIMLTHVANKFVVGYSDAGDLQREFHAALASEIAREVELESAIPRERGSRD